MITCRRWLSWLVVLIVFFTTTGCYDREELEQQAFVTEMGIDQAPGGLIDCTLRIATPTNSATGGGGGGSGGGGGGSQPLAATSPITVRADSIPQALLMANTSVERTITMSHLTLIIFGEQLAKLGLEPYIQALVREPQFRRTIFVSVAKGTAKEIMHADQPMLETSSGRTADSIYVVGNRIGLFPVVQMHDLITQIEQPHQDSVLPVYAVNKTVQSDPKGEGELEQTSVSTQPGDTVRQGGNPVEWTGAAVLRGDKLVDFLSGQEVMYLRLLRGNIKTTRIDFRLTSSETGTNSQSEQTVGLFVREEQRPRTSISLGTPARVDISVPLDVALTAESLPAQSSVDSQGDIGKAVTKQMQQDMKSLLQRLYQKDGVDPIPLSDHVRSRFRSYQAYTAYPWRQKLKSAKFNVQVQLDIRRTGQRT